MNLLVLAEDFYPNVSGGAHARWRFCQLAVERGHDVTVFTPRRPETPKRETVSGVDIVRPFKAKPGGVPAYATSARVTRAAFSVVLCCYLVWWLRRRAFDGVHSASTSLHWVGKVLSTLYGLPLVTFVGYTPSISEDPRWTLQFVRERIIFRLFMGDVVFCRVQPVKEVIKDLTPSDVAVLDGILNAPRIRDASESVDRADVRKRFGVGPEQKLVVFVGRLVPIKHCRGAIDVVERLPDDYRLIVVGDGPERDPLVEAAENRGVADRVKFGGELPHDETLGCIAAADLLLLTSEEESYATVALEALALETPVYATPVGVLPEVDNPRLALGPVERLPSLIRERSLESSSGLDEPTLARYSMERYTDSILDAFQRLGASDGDERGPATDATGTGT